MHCDADITERQTELDRLRVHLFLAGLDPQFDQVRGEILRKDPKLDLDQTFAYVRREAQQRLTMTSTPDTAVLATQRPRGPPPSTGGASQTQTTSSRPETKCTHCGGSKHTRARCYELIGYPDWWDHSKAPRRNKSTSLHTSSVTDPVSPAAPPAPAPASASVATSGTQGYVLHSSSKKHTWVIDTGATDHMTFDPGQIISHTPPSQSVVSNANGTPSPDILSNKTIGCGTRRGKLYYLDLAFDSEASLSQAYKIGGTSVEKKTSENGVAERKNRHLLEVVRASLFGAHMPRSFWGEAILSAAYLINRIPSSILQFRTPLQTLQHHSQIPPTQNLEPRIFDSFQTQNDRSLIYSDRSPDENARSQTTLPKSDRSHPSHDRSPLTSQRTIPTLPENDRSPDPHDRSLPPHHTQEERIEEFMPAPENSSAPVPHQSSAEDVIQVTSLPETDNINEIIDCISEGAEPTYQIPKRTNRGKPPVHYEADINAKGKYPINNYVSLTRLSESRVHFVKQLAEIPVPNNVIEALEDQKWKEAMNEEM
ncbi:unnamed protein product [Prunus brigantina]